MLYNGSIFIKFTELHQILSPGTGAPQGSHLGDFGEGYGEDLPSVLELQAPGFAPAGKPAMDIHIHTFGVQLAEDVALCRPLDEDAGMDLPDYFIVYEYQVLIGFWHLVFSPFPD